MTKNNENEKLVEKIKKLEKENITLKEKNEVLMEKDNIFSQIINNIPEVFYIKNLKPNLYEYVSPKFEYLYGRKAMDVLKSQTKILEMIHPDDRNKYVKGVEDQDKGKKYFNEEYRIYKNEDIKWLWVRSFPFYDPEGNVSKVVGISTDITEKKKNEELLKKSEQKLKTNIQHLIARNQQLIVSEQKLKSSSQQLQQSEKELKIRNRIATIFLTFHNDNMFNEVLNLFLEVMESKYGVFGYLDEKGDIIVPSMTRHIWDKCKVQNKDYIFPREKWRDSTWSKAIKEKRIIYSNKPSTNIPKGHIRINNHISCPIIYHGVVIGILQVANKKNGYNSKDIELFEIISNSIAPILQTRLEKDRVRKEQKITEEKLLAANERLHYLLSSTSAVIYTSKSSGDYGATFISENVTQMLGYEPRKFLEDSSFWFNHIHPDDRYHVKQEASLLFDKLFHNYEFRFKCKDSTYIWIRNEMKLVFNEAEEPTEIIGFLIDITDKKNAEESLKESEKRFKTLAENSTDVIARQDNNTRFLYINPTINNFMGLFPESIIGKTTTELGLPKEIINFWQEKINEVYKTKKPIFFEMKSDVHEGEKDFYCISVPEFDSNGNVKSVLTTSREITEKKIAEEALKESEEKFRLLFKNSPDNVGILDLDGTFLDINKVDDDYNQEDIIGTNITDYLNPEQKKIFKSSVEKVLKTNKTQSFEYTVSTPKGKAIHWNNRMSTIKLNNEFKLIINFTDITKLKKIEESLIESEERFKSLAENSPDVIARQDNNTRFLYINPTIKKLTGMNPELIIGKTHEELGLPKELIDFWNEKFDKITKTEKPTSFETIFKTLEGDRYVQCISVPEFNSQGEIYSVLTTARDITEKKKNEQQLKQYSEQLEDIIKERTKELKEAHEQIIQKEKLAVLGQLSGSIAHELRNPLGGIKNAVYFLNMKIKEPNLDIKETLNIIDREIDNSDRIIKGMLDYARTKLPNFEKIDLNNIIRNTISKINVPGQIGVEYNLDNDITTINADPNQLKQVFRNIVINAIQAMPEGGKIKIVSEILNQEQVMVSISDSGIGIPKEYHEKIFEPLYSTKTKGIGLGLPICSLLVKGHGGKIEIDSELGKGSTFKVILPLKKKMEDENEKKS